MNYTLAIVAALVLSVSSLTAADVPAVRHAELLKMAKPSYPSIARQAGIQGDVIVEVQVGADGKAKQARILKSDSPVFNDAVLAAVMEAEYEPATMPTGTVTSWVKIPFQFKKQK